MKYYFFINRFPQLLSLLSCILFFSLIVTRLPYCLSFLLLCFMLLATTGYIRLSDWHAIQYLIKWLFHISRMESNSLMSFTGYVCFLNGYINQFSIIWKSFAFVLRRDREKRQFVSSIFLIKLPFHSTNVNSTNNLNFLIDSLLPLFTQLKGFLFYHIFSLKLFTLFCKPTFLSLIMIWSSFMFKVTIIPLHIIPPLEKSSPFDLRGEKT